MPSCSPGRVRRCFTILSNGSRRFLVYQPPLLVREPRLAGHVSHWWHYLSMSFHECSQKYCCLSLQSCSYEDVLARVFRVSLPVLPSPCCGEVLFGLSWFFRLPTPSDALAHRLFLPGSSVGPTFFRRRCCGHQCSSIQGTVRRPLPVVSAALCCRPSARSSGRHGPNNQQRCLVPSGCLSVVQHSGSGLIRLDMVF